MGEGLSERARRFLEAWERRPYVDDLGLVRAALEEAGLPVTEPVLEFHHAFAGYLTDVWGDRGPLGVVHREPSARSWFEPMKVGGYLTADPPALACADIHVSWEMMINPDGTFRCNGPEASSYFLWTERQAFLWEFERAHRVRRVSLTADPDELAAVLLPRLADRRIAALSDQYGQVYATDRLVVSVGQEGRRYHAVVVDGELPPELAGLSVWEAAPVTRVG
jgi:hypothetical protein